MANATGRAENITPPTPKETKEKGRKGGLAGSGAGGEPNMAETAERKTGGQFQKGQSGNPRGRVRGVPNKISRKVLGAIAEHEEELVATLVDMALAGDVKALKICIERLSPVMREHPLPAVKLPAIETPEDLPKATGALLQAATSGTMTPGEVAALSAAVRVHVDALQTADLAERVRLLEEGGAR